MQLTFTFLPYYNSLKVRFFQQVTKKIPFELKYVLFLFITTRIVLTAIGVISRIILEPFHGKEYVWTYSSHIFLDIWGVWDTGWYLSIVQNGYVADRSFNPDTLGQANYAFFPLYPLLIKGLSFILHYHFISGIVLSNIFLILSGYLLYKLAKQDYDEDIAKDL